MSKINDSWHEILMLWGAYRSGNGPNRLGAALGLGYGQTILGKMIATVRGKTCTRCVGRGKVQDIVSGGWTKCPLCQGRGKTHVETPGKISPAMIRSTSPDRGLGGGDSVEPEICGRIDKALMQLTVKQRIVLIARYVDYPRRNDGDKRIQHVNRWLDQIGETPIGKRRMENLLSETREILQTSLGNRGGNS